MVKANLKLLLTQIGSQESKNLTPSVQQIEAKLKVIVRDFYERMSKDVLIGFFFTGKDLAPIADQQADFLLFASGLKNEYQGKLPTFAHIQLPPILQGHFDRRLVILKETLREHGIADKDIRTWIEFENAFRNVVQKDPP